MQNLNCYSFKDFKTTVESLGWTNDNIPNDVAIISICASKPESEDAYHIFNSSDNVLNIDFDDILPESIGLDEGYYEYKSDKFDVKIFNEQQAKLAYEFIDRNIKKNFYIHCSAGISRSQAFVRYIQDMYTTVKWKTLDKNPCIHPNIHVVCMLKREWYNNIPNEVEKEII